MNIQSNGCIFFNLNYLVDIWHNNSKNDKIK